MNIHDMKQKLKVIYCYKAETQTELTLYDEAATLS